MVIHFSQMYMIRSNMSMIIKELMAEVCLGKLYWHKPDDKLTLKSYKITFGYEKYQFGNSSNLFSFYRKCSEYE